MNHFNTYPEVPRGAKDHILSFFSGRSQYDWLAEELEDKPFGEWIYWARRIMSETLVKESKYSVVEYRKIHPQDPNMGAIEFYKAYQEWRNQQPDEGDLTTPFGHRMNTWFENPQVFEQFRLSYATLGWYLVSKSKDLARQKANGSMFLEADWSAILHVRQGMASIDAALYRMDLHNAGAWDLETKLADEFIWIDLLFAFAKEQNIDLTKHYTTFDKVIARNSGFCWWYNPLTLDQLPDELGNYMQDTTLSFPYEGGTIQFDLS